LPFSPRLEPPQLSYSLPPLPLPPKIPLGRMFPKTTNRLGIARPTNLPSQFRYYCLIKFPCSFFASSSLPSVLFFWSSPLLKEGPPQDVPRSPPCARRFFGSITPFSPWDRGRDVQNPVLSFEESFCPSLAEQLCVFFFFRFPQLFLPPNSRIFSSAVNVLYVLLPLELAMGGLFVSFFPLVP